MIFQIQIIFKIMNLPLLSEDEKDLLNEIVCFSYCIKE